MDLTFMFSTKIFCIEGNFLFFMLPSSQLLMDSVSFYYKVAPLRQSQKQFISTTVGGLYRTLKNLPFPREHLSQRTLI